MNSGVRTPPLYWPASGPAILVADDDELVRQFLRQLLEEQGFVVLEAFTGRAVLEQVHRTPVALVVLDLVMPEMEGLETLQSLMQLYPNIPVMAISGAFDGSFLRCARLMGAKATLKKPFHPADFLAAVRTFL